MRIINSSDAAKVLFKQVSDNYTHKDNWALLIRNALDCCEIIDEISNDCGGRCTEIIVDDDTLDITIAFTCELFRGFGNDEKTTKLLRAAKSIEIKRVDDELVEVDFIFDGFWVR